MIGVQKQQYQLIDLRVECYEKCRIVWDVAAASFMLSLTELFAGVFFFIDFLINNYTSILNPFTVCAHAHFSSAYKIRNKFSKILSSAVQITTFHHFLPFIDFRCFFFLSWPYCNCGIVYVCRTVCGTCAHLHHCKIHQTSRMKAITHKKNKNNVTKQQRKKN